MIQIHLKYKILKLRIACYYHEFRGTIRFSEPLNIVIGLNVQKIFVLHIESTKLIQGIQN